MKYASPRPGLKKRLKRVRSFSQLLHTLPRSFSHQFPRHLRRVCPQSHTRLLRWLRPVTSRAKQRIPMNGFGFLVPRSEKLRTLGTVWNSSLFPGRAPEGRIAITSFVGGATDPEFCEKPEDEIKTIVHAENARVLGINGPPVASAIWKHPKALPQYNLGHGHIVEAIRKAEQETPGLFFSANYLEGPSLGKCVEQAFATAEAVCGICRRARKESRRHSSAGGSL